MGHHAIWSIAPLDVSAAVNSPVPAKFQKTLTNH